MLYIEVIILIRQTMYTFFILFTINSNTYNYERNRPPIVTVENLVVAHPHNNTTISGAGHNIWGQSIPGIPLYLNGEEITNRTPEGFFSLFYTLEYGENHLIFSQQGQEDIERIITRGPAVPAPPVAEQPPINIFPTYQFHYATVTSPVAWLFPNSTQIGGSDILVEQGMTDRIIAQRGNWLQLSNGYWIQTGNVSRFSGELPKNELEGTIARDRNIQLVNFRVMGNHTPVARASFDKETNSITAYFGMHTSPPGLDDTRFENDNIFSEISSGIDHNGVSYIRLVIDENYRVSGFDFTTHRYTLNYEEFNWLVLTVKTPRPLSPVINKPFYGFTFIVDPGHGGTDFGAIGPMGTYLSEKHIVLSVSEKLRDMLINLGANVIMTRYYNETTVALHDRVLMSRDVRPDMFLSMHGNSVAVTTNATNIRGFTIWYRNQNSYTISRNLLNRMRYINPYTNRDNNVNRANFYVVRPTWAPHTLLELSFLSNIDDFAWMIDEVNQERLAIYTIWALIDYFS